MIDVIMKGFPQTWVQISANDEDKGEETNAVSGWKRGRVRQGGDRTKVWLTMEGEVGCVGERKVEEVWPGRRGRKRESGGEGQDEDDGKINWDGEKKERELLENEWKTWSQLITPCFHGNTRPFPPTLPVLRSFFPFFSSFLSLALSYFHSLLFFYTFVVSFSLRCYF